jgi:hypothetical protein
MELIKKKLLAQERQLLLVPPLQVAQLGLQLAHYFLDVRYLEEVQEVQAEVPVVEHVKQEESQGKQLPLDP